MTEQLARTRHLVGTTAEWAAVNPFVVAAGEIAIEIKTDQSRWIKIGDGVTTFANLEYLFDFSASPTFQNLTITGLLEAGQIEADVSGSLYIKVKNTDTETLAKGTPFYISGTASGGEAVEVKKAMASDTAKGPAIGLIADSLSVNAEGNGILVGQITGYNTVFPGWQANQALYVGQSGGLTSSEPGGYKQVVARVGRVNGSTGTLIVSGSSSGSGSGSSTLYTVGPLSRNNGVTTVGTQLREISNNTSLVASTGQVDANTAPTQFAVKEFTGSRYVTSVTSESGQPFSVSGIATKDGNGDWTFVRNISLSMNVANGLARLDSGGKIPTSLLPTSAIPTNSDAITEGTTNLYFTQARARNAISASGDLTYDSNTGVISFSSSVAITSISGVAPISVSSGSTPSVSISAATTSAAGSMSSADKVKLNGIETGAQVNVPTNLTWSGYNRTIESSTGSDAEIPLFSNSLAGLTPASGGGTANFLRADGTWTAPPTTTAGVSSFSGGTTGLTPSTASTGAVTLAGTLVVANGGTGVTTSTGTGDVVLSNSPTLLSPVLGTPQSGNLVYCTGYTFANIASKPTTLSGYGITDGISTAGNNAFTGANTFTNVTGQTFRQAATQDGILLRGRGGGTGSFVLEIVPASLSASRTLTAPNVSGTIITSADSGTVTNDMLAGSIDQGKLGNITTAGKVSGAAITYGNISTTGNIATTGSVAVGQASAAANTDLDVNGTYAQVPVAVPSLNIDCSAGNYFTKAISSSVTFTVSNVPASRAYSFTLEVTHTSGSITWFSGVEWPGGMAPSLTAGKTHLFMFVTDDGGTRWRGASVINYTN